MRKTPDSDEDILTDGEEEASEGGDTTGKLVSEPAESAPTHQLDQIIRNGVPPFPLKPGGGVVTLELVNRLRVEELCRFTCWI